MRKNQTKKIVKFLIILTVMITVLITISTKVFADVGSHQRYSGSSSSSSKSSSSSSRSRSSSSSTGGSSSGTSTGGVFSIFPVIILFLIVYFMLRKNRIIKGSAKNNILEETKESPEEIENKIKQVDPMFNKEKMESWAGDIFVKLQNAWTNRDWSIIRPFETNELFEQHNAQLQEYINNNKINVMERICIEKSILASFRQAGDKDILDINISSCMKDYIIDATTKKVLEGDKNTDRRNTYKLTFIRKTGVLTKEGEAKHSTTNCPNCGAPTQVTIAGKCDYCGSIITTGEHDWVLSGLTRIY